jgi:tRNA (cmo5U34)-methyltransferase
MSRGQFHLTPSTYLNAVRAEVPAYDDFQEAVARATDGASVSTVLELGVGTGETARRVLRRHPTARLLAIDSSEEMVMLASKTLLEAEVRVGRLEDPLPEEEFDLVISALTVHHLTSEGKRDLFVRVAQRLRFGGRFVLGDVVIPEEAGDAVTPLEPDVDIPDDLPSQLTWLTAAGLSPSVVWTYKDLAVIAADRK